MRIFISCVLMIFSFVNTSIGQGIEFFHGTWAEAKAKSKESGKLIFVDAYTSWCGPCKRMAANIFPLPEVGAYYNANFINYKLDMEKGEGPTFAREYGITAYPTFVFVDGDGKKVHFRVGGADANGFIDMGKSAVLRYDKSPELGKRYEAGDHSPELVLQYIKALNAAGKSSTRVTNDFLANDKAAKTDDYYRIIYEGAVSSDSKPFTYLVSNEKAISKIVGQKEYDRKVFNALVNTVYKGIEYDTESLIDDAITTSKKVLDKSNASLFPTYVDVIKADARNNGELYVKNVSEMIKKLGNTSNFELATIIKSLQTKYNHVANAASLASVVYKKMVDISDDPSIRLDYAVFLQDSGDNDNALKEAQKAKEEATKKNMDTTKFDNVILRIKSK
jgi:thiol-disulfide isomerase/thioredoxin